MITVAVTGADGQMGSEFRHLSERYPYFDFNFTDRDNLDITDIYAVKNYVESVNPDWIINCAAYTSVDEAEKNRDIAMKINAGGVANLVASLSGKQTGLIQLSTDYVFDGTSDRPYREEDQPAPLSVYGRSKLEGEKEAMKSDKSIIIRTSWLYSRFGKNFPKTILRLAGERPEIRVVADQTGSPTYGEDLAINILDLIRIRTEKKSRGSSNIYHLTGKGTCSWYEFAREIVRLSGSETIVVPVSTEEFPLPARRPRNSVLDNAGIIEDYGLEMPEWRVSLKRFMNH